MRAWHPAKMLSDQLLAGASLSTCHSSRALVCAATSIEPSPRLPILGRAIVLPTLLPCTSLWLAVVFTHYPFISPSPWPPLPCLDGDAQAASSAGR